MLPKTFPLQRKEREGGKKGTVGGPESRGLEEVMTIFFFQNLWGLSRLKNSYTESIADVSSSG